MASLGLRRNYGIMDLWNYGGLRCASPDYETTRQRVNKTTSGGFAGATPDLLNYGNTECFARLLVNKTMSGGFAALRQTTTSTCSL